MSFVARIPVRLADVDWARCVYFARYADYAHRAIEDFWNAQPGLSFATLMEQRSVAFAIVRSEGQFFGPLRLGDTARVVLDVTRLTNKSCTWRCGVFRGDGDERVAEVVLKQAAIDPHSFKGIELPGDVHAALAPHVVAT